MALRSSLSEAITSYGLGRHGAGLIQRGPRCPYAGKSTLQTRTDPTNIRKRWTKMAVVEIYTCLVGQGELVRV